MPAESRILPKLTRTLSLSAPSSPCPSALTILALSLSTSLALPSPLSFSAHRRSAADDDKDRGEDERLLVVRCEPGEQCGQHEAEDEWSPQVPVLERLKVGLARIEHTEHLVAHHGDVTHD
eukprot:scaffold228111_cov34-Tisochrysis_lutea.AAC.1